MAYTTIDKPTDYFNTVLYTGNDADDRSITGVTFQPDWTLIKCRTAVKPTNVFDSVRGATKRIFTGGTDAEGTATSTLKSFNSDGFVVGTHNNVNANSETYVSWNWKANGSGSSNSDGSITSTVSANTTSGFSIVSYTGTGSNATVGHGLGVKPDLIIAKNRTDAVDWYVYHSSLGATKNLRLNQTYAELTESEVWDNTEPTTSVISVNNANGTNGSSDNLIFYCMTSKKGFSKFGSYTGNGNADGTFVYTGFRPAWVMVKKTNATHNWTILDTKRNPINDAELALEANLNNAEGSGNNMDILSNGFKFRATGEWGNGSGGSYIYMCFAENPFVTSSGIPTTAR